jgi:hypothetical protein
VQTIKLGEQAEFRLNIHMSSEGKLEPVHQRWSEIRSV